MKNIFFFNMFGDKIYRAVYKKSAERVTAFNWDYEEIIKRLWRFNINKINKNVLNTSLPNVYISYYIIYMSYYMYI